MKTSIKFSGFLIILLAVLFVPPAAAKAPPPPYTPPFPFAPALIPSQSAQFDITGFIQEATLDPAGIAGDPLAGGTLRMNGHLVIVPKNTIVIMPATALTWQEIFARAPAPYGLTTAAGVPETGLALKDTPRPFTTYEVEVVGNRISTPTSNLYIAGLIYISPQFLHSGQGYINFIDYANATMWVGSKLAMPMTGTRLQINDPPIINGSGRYSRGVSPDVRFTVDVDNPTITARSAYPMGLPEVLNDPKRPESNRPIDTNPNSFAFGHFLTIYTMTDIANLTAGTDPGPKFCRACDPRLQVPFEVGDFITYSGMLVHDGLYPTAMVPGTPNTTYISATTIVDDLSVNTFPGSDPAYVRTDVTILGTGGTRILGFTEIGARDRFEGFSTDPSRNVHLFGIDVNANASFAPIGTTFDRDWGSSDVDPGQQPPLIFGVQRGRWRFRPPTSVLTLPPAGILPPTNKGGLRRVTIAESFLPATREMRAVISTGEVAGNSSAPFTLANITPAANGILAGQYHVPILSYIFPENLVGTPQIQDNFVDMPFLFDGGYSSATGVIGGMLYPFPSVWDPTAVIPYIPALNATFVSLEFPMIAVGGTELFNALPLDQFGVPFTPIVNPVVVTFNSSNPAVATINLTTGLVTGISPGTATLTATAISGNTTVTGTATIIVTGPTVNLTVSTINVAPATAVLVAGINQPFAATTLDQFGNPIAATVTWNSSNLTVGTINASTGLFTALAVGTTFVNATNGTVKGSASVTVIAAPVLTTITVTPANASLNVSVNPTQTFTATTLNQFGNPIAAAVTWSSSNPAVGTIDATGFFTALAAGTTFVNATSGAVNGSASVTVTAPLPVGGVIRGTVFNDSNSNKIQDPTEQGLANWTIKLTGFDALTSKFVSKAAVTDASGNYSFTNLNQGSYTVSETVQPGWLSTTGFIRTVNLAANGTLTVDFGNRRI